MNRSQTTPVVSVLLPVYNTAQYLSDAVESILRQTFDRFELIAVDDGSEDDSAAVLDRYARVDGRIRVFRTPHLGQCHTRNLSIREARGEFLAELDSDDIAMPRRLELQIDYLRRHPDCVVVGGQGEQIDPEGELIGPISVRTDHDEIEEELFQGRGSAIIHSTATYRRADVVEAGGYDKDLRDSEDLALFLKLAERGRLANMPELMVVQRKHPRSASGIFDEARAQQSKVDILREACRRRNISEEHISVRRFYYPRSEPEMYLSWAALSLRSLHLRTAIKYGRHLLKGTWDDPGLWWRFTWSGAVRSGAWSVRKHLRWALRRAGGSRPSGYRGPLL